MTGGHFECREQGGLHIREQDGMDILRAEERRGMGVSRAPQGVLGIYRTGVKEELGIMRTQAKPGRVS